MNYFDTVELMKGVGQPEPNPDGSPGKKNGPTRMYEAVVRGDVRKVVALFENDPSYEQTDFAKVMPWFSHCIQVAAERDAEDVIEFLFSQMLAFQGSLLFRVQCFVESEMRYVDSGDQGRPAGLPDHVAEEWLPRMQRLHESIKSTTKTFATVRHTLALAKDREETQERGETAGKQAA